MSEIKKYGKKKYGLREKLSEKIGQYFTKKYWITISEDGKRCEK